METPSPSPSPAVWAATANPLLTETPSPSPSSAAGATTTNPVLTETPGLSPFPSPAPSPSPSLTGSGSVPSPPPSSPEPSPGTPPYTSAAAASSAAAGSAAPLGAAANALSAAAMGTATAASVATSGASSTVAAVSAAAARATTSTASAAAFMLLSQIQWVALTNEFDPSLLPRAYRDFAASFSWSLLSSEEAPLRAPSGTSTSRRLLRAATPAARERAAATRWTNNLLTSLFLLLFVAGARPLAWRLLRRYRDRLRARDRAAGEREPSRAVRLAAQVLPALDFPKPELMAISACYPGVCFAAASVFRTGSRPLVAAAAAFLALGPLLYALGLVCLLANRLGRPYRLLLQRAAAVSASAGPPAAGSLLARLRAAGLAGDGKVAPAAEAAADAMPRGVAELEGQPKAAGPDERPQKRRKKRAAQSTDSSDSSSGSELARGRARAPAAAARRAPLVLISRGASAGTSSTAAGSGGVCAGAAAQGPEWDAVVDLLASPQTGRVLVLAAPPADAPAPRGRRRAPDRPLGRRRRRRAIQPPPRAPLPGRPAPPAARGRSERRRGEGGGGAPSLGAPSPAPPDSPASSPGPPSPLGLDELDEPAAFDEGPAALAPRGPHLPRDPAAPGPSAPPRAPPPSPRRRGGCGGRQGRLAGPLAGTEARGRPPADAGPPAAAVHPPERLGGGGGVGAARERGPSPWEGARPGAAGVALAHPQPAPASPDPMRLRGQGAATGGGGPLQDPAFGPWLVGDVADDELEKAGDHKAGSRFGGRADTYRVNEGAQGGAAGAGGPSALRRLARAAGAALLGPFALAAKAARGVAKAAAATRAANAADGTEARPKGQHRLAWAAAELKGASEAALAPPAPAAGKGEGEEEGDPAADDEKEEEEEGAGADLDSAAAAAVLASKKGAQREEEGGAGPGGGWARVRALRRGLRGLDLLPALSPVYAPFRLRRLAFLCGALRLLKFLVTCVALFALDSPGAQALACGFLESAFLAFLVWSMPHAARFLNGVAIAVSVGQILFYCLAYAFSCGLLTEWGGGAALVAIASFSVALLLASSLADLALPAGRCLAARFPRLAAALRRRPLVEAAHVAAHTCHAPA
eukprot:tig00021579_g22429.t1